MTAPDHAQARCSEGRRGLLVSLDGPGGAGKTTLAAAITARLHRDGIAATHTTQPSHGPIGQLARAGTHQYRGLTLACLVAADRYHHLDTQIRPALAAGHIVICDRYTPSSHVLQVLDGVDPAFVALLNQHADPPDLAVILTCDPGELTRRLTARGSHGRFEDDPGLPALEATAYRRVIDRLTCPALVLDSTDSDTRSLTTQVVNAIKALPSAP
ncbi:dTMP kinase [Actinomadura macrotermitis]|uniref:Thymidylate kinase n=1 Tax=Actinomadura macrotermitis TaxID=2585200 RepID=A0A7K0BR01_9ACTN|nr:dTMP kinase [Actinomadura macrotermitis]MQY03589.1 Thymidylate kinase [Actinomadura macrotermitis]